MGGSINSKTNNAFPAVQKQDSPADPLSAGLLKRQPEAPRVVGVAEDITRWKNDDELQNRQTEQLQALSLKLIEARESERKYIASELHDEIGQLATVLKLGVDVLEPGRPVPEERIVRLRTLADELIQQIRNLSLGLRPSMLDDFGLQPAVQWLCDRLLAQTGTRIMLRYSGLSCRFPPDVEITAYRAVQEALTNVVRHADVDAASVEIVSENGSIVIEVSDDGCGFNVGDCSVAGACAGLLGMRERVQSLGGHLTVTSRPGAGTAIRVVIPAPKNCERKEP